MLAMLPLTLDACRQEPVVPRGTLDFFQKPLTPLRAHKREHVSCVENDLGVADCHHIGLGPKAPPQLGDL